MANNWGSRVTATWADSLARRAQVLTLTFRPKLCPADMPQAA